MQKWKVEFYGEFTSWECTGLSFAAAKKRVDSCPQKYMAFMAPYDEGDK